MALIDLGLAEFVDTICRSILRKVETDAGALLHSWLGGLSAAAAPLPDCPPFPHLHPLAHLLQANRRPPV
mgnify:CR=1 FL=1